MRDKKNYLIYKIVNKINNMIYIGCHVTTNINDRYMGSGTNIKKAIKQYGLENFDKYILYQFDNEVDMLNKEEELVSREFISEENNYNIIVGGKQFLTLDNVTVRDKYGNTFNVHKTDERYISGELVGATKGLVTVRDKDGNTQSVKINDERYLSGELLPSSKGFILTKDKDDKRFYVNLSDPRYLSGELIPFFKGRLTLKDRFGNIIHTHKDDPRYLSGELNHLWTNKKHTIETKEKIGLKNSILQKGEKNSQFGSCWITKENKNKKIKKEELENYLSNGWEKGRFIK
jgi:hypothetical protein